MAKQINTEEDNTATATVTENTPAPEKAKRHSEETRPEGYALAVLQSFPCYEKLYVDKQGGIYTPDTPENLRGMATLYVNPYFKP